MNDIRKACVEVLPAHAGMIPGFVKITDESVSAPRTCGDDPRHVDLGLPMSVCSPHMRG